MIDSSSQDINYFSYQKITDGVYAAIANEQQGTSGNCGIIDIGDHTLILDTSESIKSAHELRKTAERLTGRPPTILVISHAHPDHTFGMKAFSDVPIIASTPIIHQEILGLQEYAVSMRKELPDWKTFLAEQQVDLESETDERRREHLIKSIKRTEQSIQNIPHLELRLPNMTFDQRLILHGQDRTVELITNGKGHTVSDCYILLPEPFDTWSIDGTPSEPNVRFYYNRLTIQEEEYPI